MAEIAEAQQVVADSRRERQREIQECRLLAAPLQDLAHDMRLRQAIVVSAVLKGGPLEVTHRDVFDSAAHDLDVRRTPTGYSVALKPAPN